MPRIASLPMYDLPEVRRATDAWWSGLAAALRRAGLAGVPARLARDADPELAWRHPGLLLSQVCGYPLLGRLGGHLQVVATPVYAAPGCDGPRYRSAIVVPAAHPARRLADLRGALCAVNSRRSHSGCNALRAAVAPLAGGGAFFGGVRLTGSHGGSLALVARARAEVCAVDCVTLALYARHRPAALHGTRVLAWTAPAAGLPYVTRRAAGAGELQRLREGLAAALASPRLAAAREALLLAGAERLEEEAYLGIREMERQAAARGYPELR